MVILFLTRRVPIRHATQLLESTCVLDTARAAVQPIGNKGGLSGLQPSVGACDKMRSGMRSDASVTGPGVDFMKPIALALCLAAVTATAQAQTAVERGPKAARHAAASRKADAPSPVSTFLKWLHDKSQLKAAARTRP